MKLQKAKELADQIKMDDRIKWNGIPRYTHIIFAPAEYLDNPFLYFEKITFPANVRVDFSFEVVLPEENEGELVPYVVTARQTLAETLKDFLKEIKLFSEYQHYFH